MKLKQNKNVAVYWKTQYTGLIGQEVTNKYERTISFSLLFHSFTATDLTLIKH